VWPSPAALDAAAASSGIEKLKLQAEGFRVELEKLAAQSDLVKEKFDTIGESAFSDFLADAVTDIRNVEDAFKRMTDTIFREVTKLASQDIAKKIMGGAADNGFGFGALMSKIFGGMLGGGGGGQFTNQALALSGFANGGSFLVGGSGGVDDTPVAFRATRGERVTVTQPGQSPGGVNVVNNFHISGPADARSQQQIALQVGRSVNRAIARNG
jgi:hypothetical protein